MELVFLIVMKLTRFLAILVKVYGDKKVISFSDPSAKDQDQLSDLNPLDQDH